ncbi:hypothetical protein EGT07_24925 [Herbaspirillum sp. HC18]|nr:hypothetical protein EGT07_24925 [Herbaspirillum sp. HC18]
MEFLDVRRFLCIILMLLLPLHSFAVQVGRDASASAFDIAHEVDHLVGAAHHHDDDHGSVHYDNSGDSAHHFAEHAAGHACPALPTTMMLPLAIDGSVAIVPDLPHYLPDPFPERLQRPPCSLG